MAQFGNMGPFGPVNLKGGGYSNAIPVFRDKLPLTMGGLAGDGNCVFGRFAYQSANNPNVFVSTGTAGTEVGVFIQDPSIMAGDPGMNDRYYEGRPCTILIFGEAQYEVSASATTVPAKGQTITVIGTDGKVVTTAAYAITGSVASSTATVTTPKNKITDVKGPNNITAFFNFLI